MITLNENEKLRLQEIADNYKADVFGSVFDKEKAVEGCKYLYSLAGLKLDYVIFAESPLAARYIAKMIGVGKHVDEKEMFDSKPVEIPKPDEVWMKAVDSMIEALVRNPITGEDYSQYKDNVKNYFMKHCYKVSDNEVSFCWSGSVSDCGYLSFFKLFLETGKLEGNDNEEAFEKLDSYIRSGIYDAIQLGNVCIVVGHPRLYKFDSEGKYHCEDGYAVQWRDGLGYCLWHGLKVPEQLIFFPETITKQNINEIENVEIKRAYMERLGEKRFFELLDVEVIDESTDHSGRPIQLYKTINIDPLAEDYIYYIKICDHSTEREYFICVEGSSGNARTELARSYGKQTWEDYNPEIET